jgi:hypothetical protein
MNEHCNDLLAQAVEKQSEHVLGTGNWADYNKALRVWETLKLMGWCDDLLPEKPKVEDF